MNEVKLKCYFALLSEIQELAHYMIFKKMILYV